MRRGKLIGLGVGPGDPELMTMRGVRALEKTPAIADVSGCALTLSPGFSRSSLAIVCASIAESLAVTRESRSRKRVVAPERLARPYGG